MGMFDSFLLDAVKCPHCGNVADMEMQTKQFKCTMQVWEQGFRFNVDNIEIINGVIQDAYGGCKVRDNPNCGLQWELKRYEGRMNGFGRPVVCDVNIINGFVVGAINVRPGEE